MSLLPIWVKMQGRRTLVVGAGTVALEKVASLLQTGARLTVVAPEAKAEIRALGIEGRLEWVQREFAAADLDAQEVVIAATDVAEVNATVYRTAVERGVWCNSVDDIPNCDFFFGSVVRRGELQIAISTAGESPALAQRLRKEIDARLPEELGAWLERMGRLRREILATMPAGEERKALLHELAQEAPGFGDSVEGMESFPQGLKPDSLGGYDGTAKQLAEKGTISWKQEQKTSGAKAQDFCLGLAAGLKSRPDAFSASSESFKAVPLQGGACLPERIRHRDRVSLQDKACLPERIHSQKRGSLQGRVDGNGFDAAQSQGKVWLVGAGPGDPELLTVRAVRLIESADVILHDDLVPDAVLELAQGAEMVNVGKRCGTKRITQDDINAMMVERAREGRSVVRLKCGDPLIFGRAAEEMDALREAGVEFDVVPGITSALAAAAAIPASLTDRRSASSVKFSTGHHAQSHDEDAMPAVENTTRVVYMPGRDLTLLAAEWTLEGLPAEFPCVLVSRAAQPDQEIHHTTLGKLPGAGPVEAPSLLLAGWALQDGGTANAMTVATATQAARA